MIDLKKLKKQAKKDTDAMVKLARVYMTGEGLDYTSVDEAVVLLNKASKKKNADAKLMLVGLMLKDEKNMKKGQLTKSAKKEVLKLLKEAQELGSSHAKYVEAKLYYDGVLQPAGDFNYDDAIDALAGENNAFALYEVAQRCEKSVEDSSANDDILEIYKQASELKCPQADYVLGVKYLLGNGVEKDENKAKEYFENAAKHNIKEAYYAIGYMYDLGIVYEQNYWKAFSNYKKAYDLGDKFAAVSLGYSAMTGLGCDIDGNVALDYFREALQNGYKLAHYFGGMCIEKGIVPKKTLKDALANYKKLENEGMPQVLYRMACLYDSRKGKVVADDPDKAIYYYDKAYELGSIEAGVEIGLAYRDGFGKLKQNESEAYNRLITKANKQNARALEVLAECYEKGLLVDKDIKKANEAYELAATYGSELACDYLYKSYQKGLNGIEKDVKKAILIKEKMAIIGKHEYFFEIAESYYKGKEPFEKNFEKAAFWYAMTIREEDNTKNAKNSRKILEKLEKDVNGVWTTQKLAKASYKKAKKK